MTGKRRESGNNSEGEIRERRINFKRTESKDSIHQRHKQATGLGAGHQGE